MRFYIKTETDDQQELLKKINRLRQPKIIEVIPSENNSIIIITEPFASDQTKQIEKTTKKLEDLPNVESVSAGPIYKENAELKDNITKRTCHFFFDIDSTLTRYSTGTINRQVKPLFRKMNEDHFLYLVSGRSHTKIMEDMKNLEYVEDYAIAENGGIILRGYAAGTEHRFGSREEPAKVWDFLIANNDDVKQDKSQGRRLTEIIVLPSDTLTDQDIENAIEQTGADVQVLASKTSFHISKKGVDKGTAIEELSSQLGLGDELTIGVGDSQLDVPMFMATDEGFAPHNASDEIQNMTEKRPTIMSKDYFEGVIEMYEKYFKK